MQMAGVGRTGTVDDQAARGQDRPVENIFQSSRPIRIIMAMRIRGILMDNLLHIRLRWHSGLSAVLVVCVLAAVLPSHAAQPVAARRIGYVTLDPADVHAPFGAAFRQGLRERGYIEGQNIAIEWRFAGNDPSRLAGLAAELIRLRVEILVADGTQAALAAKRATSTIPIVVPSSSDLVAAGLVASLARPGGNVTGLVLMSPDLVGKRLALLKEVAPRTRRVAVLLNPDNPACEFQLSAAKAAAPALGLELYPIRVRQVKDLDHAFSPLVGRIDSVLVTDDVLLDGNHPRIGTAAARSRLVSICGYPLPGDTGCLMWYGPDVVALYPRAARLVDLILKGAKPADLPVEQPTTFRLIINLKAAKAIRRTIPQSVLVRADEVIR
jgi:putative ABC transport system substrate-binding protein